MVRFVFKLQAVNTYGSELTKAWNGYLLRRAQCGKQRVKSVQFNSELTFQCEALLITSKVEVVLKYFFTLA